MDTSLLGVQRTHGNHYAQRFVSETVIQRKCASDGASTGCGAERAQHEQKMIQQILQNKGGGQHLETGVREFMETRFGEDFSDVRVHIDSQAAQAARQVNAVAFTTGRDIFFGAGQYRPVTQEGGRLLAHELAHVRQQRGASLSSPATMSVNHPGDRYEQDADRVAAAVTGVEESLPPATSQDTRMSLDHPPAVQRMCAGPTRTRNAIISQKISDYDQAVKAGKYCKDTSITGIFHPGTTCYREIPTRSSYTDCPSGDQTCFDRTGKCESESFDKVSPVEKQNPDGSCNLHGLCSLKHAVEDVAPWLFGSPGRGALTGAGAGMLVGAGIGGIAGGGLGALIGAGVGLAAGAGIGALVGLLRS